MGPYWHWYAGGTVALLATNYLSVTIPLHLATGVDALARGAAGGPTVAREAAIVAAMGVGVIAVRTLSRVLYFTPGRYVEQNLRRDLFEAILRHQPSFLVRYSTGDLYSRLSSDVGTVRLLAGFGTLQVANAGIAFALAGAQMLRLSAPVAWWLLLPIALALIVVQVLIQRMYKLMRRGQEELAALSGQVLSTYKGIAAVQGFAAEDAFTRDFDQQNDQYLRTTVERTQVRAALGPLLALAADLNVWVLLLLAGPRVIDGTMTVGQFVAFTTLVAFVTGPLRTSSFLWSIVKQAQASIERVEAILSLPPDRPEGDQGRPSPSGAPSIELRHLTFAWPGRETPALRDVSVTVPAGKSLGILGATGSGKSTLASLLTRSWNPPRGTLFIDGIDVLDLDLDAWRKAVTLVPQRPFLFGESIADNILLGRDDPGALEQATRLAALGPDLAALPQGKDTIVGEHGVRLSGGQRQRTALARGLIRDHRVLILDDVLSAVDHATEVELIDNLRTLGERGVTTVLIAHRVSALLHTDQVIVLDEGKVIDAGTPAELLGRPGRFRDTWDQQQAGEAS